MPYNPILSFTKITDEVHRLNTSFRFEPIRHAKKGFGNHTDFACLVESNMWRADGTITRGMTHTRNVITMRGFKDSAVLFWEEKHCIDSMLHRQGQIKLYKTFQHKAARAGCKKLNDRIAALIAPSQRAWIHHHNLAATMMMEAHKYLVAYQVMSS